LILTDFKIGETFYCDNNPFRCTDIGTRVIIGIPLDRSDNPSWYNGPPYAISEYVFDEDDLKVCTSAVEGTPTNESNQPQIHIWGGFCLECFRGNIIERVLPEYEITAKNGVLFTVKNAKVGVCSECNVTYVDPIESIRWRVLLKERGLEPR